MIDPVLLTPSAKIPLEIVVFHLERAVSTARTEAAPVGSMATPAPPIPEMRQSSICKALPLLNCTPIAPIPAPSIDRPRRVTSTPAVLIRTPDCHNSRVGPGTVDCDRSIDCHRAEAASIGALEHAPRVRRVVSSLKGGARGGTGTGYTTSVACHPSLRDGQGGCRV